MVVLGGWVFLMGEVPLYYTEVKHPRGAEPGKSVIGEAMAYGWRCCPPWRQPRGKS